MRITDEETHYSTEQKRGNLFGGSATDEALDSSKAVLKRGRGANGTLVGLQSWYTPKEISQLAAAVIGRSHPTIDTTAGDGSMLQAFDKSARFGIEIDRDPIKAGNYTALQGDVQKAVPMMRAADVGFVGVAINPPFGLTWIDPAHAKGKPNAPINSTALAYLHALDIMATYGSGLMLCGTTRITTHVESLSEASGIYAQVDITDKVWDTVELPTSIIFFVKPTNRRAAVKPLRLLATMRDLPGLARQIVAHRSKATSYVLGPEHGSTGILDSTKDAFSAVVNEYDRRRKIQDKGKAAVRADLALKGNKIASYPGAYNRIVLAKQGILRYIELLNNQSVNYFATNGRAWEKALEAEAAGNLTIEDNLKARVAKVLANRDVAATPLFEIKPHMRLGWLPDLDKIACIKSDPDQGFAAGASYAITTESIIKTTEEHREREKASGEPEIRTYKQERKLLQITIKNASGHLKIFDETGENTAYLTDHFEIPDPQSVAERYPEKVFAMRQLLERIQAKHGYRLKDFQIDHLSRLLTKERGLLAHEQGLGKTLMLMTLAEAASHLGAKNLVLYVAPQDLLPQWGREAKKFFGRERRDLKSPKDVAEIVFGKTITEIRSPAEAHKVKRFIEGGGEGWFITYYECLDRVGNKKELLPEIPLNPKVALQARLHRYKEWKSHVKTSGTKEAFSSDKLITVADLEEEQVDLGFLGDDPHRAQETQKRGHQSAQDDNPATSRWACPKCLTDTAHGWTGEVCRDNEQLGQFGCGYVHRRLRTKPGYTHLTSCFQKGVICVDEISEIRGDTSNRSRCMRGMARGPWKFGGTGTPLSNFINDAYWGLWWTLGNASQSFPYDYDGGKAKFEQDFCVIEHMMGRDEEGEGHKRKQRTILPKVTNVSQFWRLTQPSVSRCRKEQTGEPLVERIYHMVNVPQGVAQLQMQDFWLNHFIDYFTWKYPDHKLVKAGEHVLAKFQAALGQLWRLEHAATMPAEDEATHEWPTARRQPFYKGISNWTPAALKTLELAVEAVERGDKVLIGSDLISTGKWISDRLREKGINSVHLTEEKQGKTSTKNPRKRAKEVTEFVEGSAQVMCAGVQAMKLGHNLDVASTVIVHGMPYSFMVMDQFIARVHRLTSKRPVNVYVVVPKGSLAERKWQLLKDKGGTSDLAFDGELMAQDERKIDWSKVLKEMQQRGVRATGEEMMEADVQAQWAKTHYKPPFTPYKIPVSEPQFEKHELAPAGADEIIRDTIHSVPDQNAAYNTIKARRNNNGHKPPTKLPAQLQREKDATARKEAQAKRAGSSKEAKNNGHAAGLFEMDQDGTVTYTQDALF